MSDHIDFTYDGVCDYYHRGTYCRVRLDELVDYIPGTGIAKGVRLHGYRLRKIENGTVLIEKEGHGPLDGVPFRVNDWEIRPTTECPRAAAERVRHMAADRCKARRAARRAGHRVKANAPVRFTQHGAYVHTEGEAFVPMN